MAGETVGGEGHAGVSECQRGEADLRSIFEKAEAVMERVSRIEQVRIGTVPIQRTYCFDLDGTLCSQEAPGYYSVALPVVGMIEAIRRLKAAGHTIVIHTARAPSKGGDPTGLTVDQLRAWRVPYDRLYFGKPAADVYVDDRAISPAEFLRCHNPAGPPDQSGGGDVP